VSELVRICPVCGELALGEPYDIGSGPELSCARCEWCWGAEGQQLTPVSSEQTLALLSRLRRPTDELSDPS
jgi:hypothetical protein